MGEGVQSRLTVQTTHPTCLTQKLFAKQAKESSRWNFTWIRCPLLHPTLLTLHDRLLQWPPLPSCHRWLHASVWVPVFQGPEELSGWDRWPQRRNFFQDPRREDDYPKEWRQYS